LTTVERSIPSCSATKSLIRIAAAMARLPSIVESFSRSALISPEELQG
jgi:hypothetical protein